METSLATLERTSVPIPVGFPRAMPAPPSLHPTPSPIRVCAGCGVIAPVQRSGCSLCGVAFAPVPLVAAGGVGSAVFARIHESDFECRGCGLRSPITVTFEAEVECPRCLLRQAFAPGQWEKALDVAHGVADLCGPDPEGRFAGMGPSIASKNPSKSLGVEHTRTESTQCTTIIDGGGMKRLTLRVSVSPGHPLCPRCHLPLLVTLDGHGGATTECATCSDRATYALPARSAEKAPRLLAVIGEDLRTDRPSAKVDKVDAAGVAALLCPTCGAALPVTTGAELATCGFCHTTSRVARRAWARASSAVPPFEPFWVLLSGPSDQRRKLSGAGAEHDDDADDDGEDDDAAERGAAPAAGGGAGWDAGTIRLVVAIVVLVGVGLVTAGMKLYAYLDANYDLSAAGGRAPPKPAAPRPATKPVKR
jgi:hypothetical protein